MARQLVECVPNFSVGRDSRIVDRIAAAIGSVPGVLLLDRTLDPDHNRSVITFAGSPAAVQSGALLGVEKAVELIDLNSHAGVHPRMGAADVLPFVPVEGVSLADCADIAHSTGEQIWRRYRVPVYFYEAAARSRDRVRLENIRMGKFSGPPDVGDVDRHATAGAIVVGARKFLIAYNINLDTPDVSIAKKIARAIRESAGGLAFVKAMGVRLDSRNLAQVSMNLTDFEQTSVTRVFDAVREQAEHYGAGIVNSEIVGLVPQRALGMQEASYVKCENFSSALTIENRIREEESLRALE